MGHAHFEESAAAAPMTPQGYPETLVGLLLDAPRHPILLLDDGGEWRLEIAWIRWRHLLGKRVRVEGTRDGIDMIAVDAISEAREADEIIPLSVRPIMPIE